MWIIKSEVCSLVVQQQILLYLLSVGSRVSRLWFEAGDPSNATSQTGSIRNEFASSIKESPPSSQSIYRDYKPQFVKLLCINVQC